MKGTGTAQGPMWGGGHLTVLQEDEDGNRYSIQWLPDKNNHELREADDKRMRFYYMLDRPRMAKDLDGHYKFHLQKFQGVMNPDLTIGQEDYAEVSGGYLSLTTTMKIPEQVMAPAREKLMDKLEDEDRHLLDWNSDMLDPYFDQVPVTDNKTKLDPVSAEERGLTPRSDDHGFEEDIPPWGWDLRGGGDGSLNMEGTNAFTAMVGPFPVTLMEGAAESGQTNLRVVNHVTYNAWVPEMEITIEGEWEAIHTHFSAEYGTGQLFSSTELGFQLEHMEREGFIDVEISYNEAWADEEQMNKWEDHADEIAKKFMELAKDTILEREEPDVESASADTGLLGLGEGLSVKAEADIASLEQTYTKKINRMVERTSDHSATLEGLFDEIQGNPEAKDRYFSDVYLDEAFRKIHVKASSNAYWEDPIEQITLTVGYPDSDGDVVPHSSARYRDSESDTDISDDFRTPTWIEDTQDRLYFFDFTRHDDVEERDPATIDLYKHVSFEQHPRVFVDEVEEKWQSDEHIVEATADPAGKLDVDPISIDTRITSELTTVYVTIRNPDVPAETIEFDQDSADETRAWRAWYESADDIPPYEYKVEVVVEGESVLEGSLDWESEWQQEEGSGSLRIEVPEPPEEIREDVVDRL